MIVFGPAVIVFWASWPTLYALVCLYYRWLIWRELFRA